MFTFSNRSGLRSRTNPESEKQKLHGQMMEKTKQLNCLARELDSTAGVMHDMLLYSKTIAVACLKEIVCGNKNKDCQVYSLSL